MDWRESYAGRRCSAEEALSVVESGVRVVLGHAAGEPTPLVEELVRQKDRLRDVEIVHMVALGEARYCRPEMAEHFRHNAIFAGRNTQAAIAEGRADYTPCYFSEVPRLFSERILPADVALIQVSPPDEEGRMSYGVSVDYTQAAAESARIVIAEVNKRMPRTRGSTISVDRVTHLVETDRPVIEIPLPKISDVEERIGRHVAEQVPDGACLQLGIGAIPDAVLGFLGQKRDLGVHSEMFSDGVVDLFERGVITGKRKEIGAGKLTACFLMGSKRLYDFVDENANVEMRPASYTNLITVAGAISNLISINSALQVDLHGQVAADPIGSRQYSGVGGQVDFVRAASLSPGGKSIIALPATARGGTVSRIVAQLDPGTCVTTSRGDVHYIVTEHGAADLRGKSIRQRTRALLQIADPAFREEIEKAAASAGLRV